MKYFECKGCHERFNVNMESSNKGYCYFCNEFYMKKQLIDKDGEIETLKSIISISNEKLLLNTKQVCDKIRQAIMECDFVIKDRFYYTKQIELNDKIDKVEKGE